MSDERCACGRFTALPGGLAQIADGTFHFPAAPTPTCEVESLRSRLAAAEDALDEFRPPPGGSIADAIITMRTRYVERLAAAERERDAARAVRDRALQNHALERQAAEARLAAAEEGRDEASQRLQASRWARERAESRASRLEAALRGTARVRDDGSPCWCQDFQPHHGEACLRARAALAEGE